MSLPANTSILEGVITTVNPQPPSAPISQRVNIAPMGPIVDDTMTQFHLRPFNTSTTYQNLKATGQAVFHVTDDVLLLARAAIGTVKPSDDVQVQPAANVEGLILTGACRYYELEVIDLDDRDPRTSIRARVVGTGRLRDFFGFNRARHAVLEAAILATRVHLTPAAQVIKEFERLQVMVEKTGSEREHLAMSELRDYVNANGGNDDDDRGGRT